MNQRIGIEYEHKCKEEILFENISSVDAQTAATLLNRMSLRAQVLDSDTLRVDIPVTRADILHFCDIAEDCAVAYGFNKILKTVPKTSCIGNQVRENTARFFSIEFYCL
jgi:phenylalanyl-tRNA synthetase beta subunit